MNSHLPRRHVNQLEIPFLLDVGAVSQRATVMGNANARVIAFAEADLNGTSFLAGRPVRVVIRSRVVTTILPSGEKPAKFSEISRSESSLQEIRMARRGCAGTNQTITSHAKSHRKTEMTRENLGHEGLQSLISVGLAGEESPILELPLDVGRDQRAKRTSGGPRLAVSQEDFYQTLPILGPVRHS